MQPVTLTPAQAKRAVMLVGVSAIVALGASFYWGWHYSGLYKILADFNIRIFGSYDVNATGLFTFLLSFAAVCIPLALVSKLAYGDTGEVKNTPILPPQQITSLKAVHNVLTSTKYKYSLVALFVGIAFLGIGFVSLVKGVFAGELTALTSDVLLGSGKPASHYVTVTGTPDTYNSVVISETNKADTYYTPLYNNEDALLLIVETKQQEKIESDTTAFTGILSNHLDGFAGDLLKKNDVPINNSTYVLNLDDSPSNLIGAGITGLVGGCIVTAFAIFVLVKKAKQSVA